MRPARFDHLTTYTVNAAVFDFTNPLPVSYLVSEVSNADVLEHKRDRTALVLQSSFPSFTPESCFIRPR
jgi:hypothetical protein